MSNVLQTQTIGHTSADSSGAVARAVGMPRIGAIPDTFPVGRVGLDPLAKLLVFQTRARQHGNEATTGAVDVIHVLPRA